MSDTADYSRGEPPPQPGSGPSIHDLVMGDIVDHWTVLSEAHKVRLVGEMEDRRMFGLEKYGTILQANNGRIPLNDAIDEICDLLVYVRQDIAENPHHQINLHSVYNTLIEIAIRMMYAREARKAHDTD